MEHSSVYEYRARFTKMGKLAREHSSKTAPMSVEISAGDLLTTHKLKHTDATSNFHNDQCNPTSAAQISVRIFSDSDNVFFWHSK